MHPAWSLLLVACAGTVIGDSDDPFDSDIDVDTDTRPPEDLDSDGFASDVDCNDLDPSIYPGADEIAWNGKDEDCDGRIDADGTYLGQATVQFQATVEGRTTRWTLTCPTEVDRVRSQVGFVITCRAPEGDALALQVMGEQFTVRERANVAETAVLEGAVLVQSTDGWQVEGTGRVVFDFDQDVGGVFSMRSVFARASGSFEAVYEP